MSETVHEVQCTWGTLYIEVSGIGWGILVAEENYACGFRRIKSFPYIEVVYLYDRFDSPVVDMCNGSSNLLLRKFEANC